MFPEKVGERKTTRPPILYNLLQFILKQALVQCIQRTEKAPQNGNERALNSLSMHRVTSLGLYGPPQIARTVMLTTHVK